jgi:hypothetical protein
MIAAACAGIYADCANSWMSRDGSAFAERVVQSIPNRHRVVIIDHDITGFGATTYANPPSTR